MASMAASVGVFMMGGRYYSAAAPPSLKLWRTAVGLAAAAYRAIFLNVRTTRPVSPLSRRTTPRTT